MIDLRFYKKWADAQIAADRLRDTYGMQMDYGKFAYSQGDNTDSWFPCGETKAIYVFTRDRIDVTIFAYLED